ncbi:MAG TPA: 30S ribosomal protein S11 [Candidatus Absconditabacterales bacterium]|nr:30S ribosomal protein S11 [Candidatus Absconditabacterales bacterium]HMT26851.1 30S ribosomal protein S11 [Candidatus Absconditabacterales bacterium]
MAQAVVKPKKKKDSKIASGLLHVYTSPNNTIVTLTDDKGNKVLGGGTGMAGFKGAKENTPYAAEVLTKKILKDAKDRGLKEVAVIIRGIGLGRDGVFKAINETGLIDILYITEKTGVQFGGCKGYRPKRM